MEYRVEPLDLMQHINTKYREPFIREVICLDQDINIDSLKSAVRQLTEEFPLLKCRYDKDRNVYVDNASIQKMDSFVVSASESDYESLLFESLDDAFFKVSVIENSTLIIVISHMIADGSGFKKILYRLASAYSNKADDILDSAMNRDFTSVSKMVPNAGKATMKMLLSMIGKYKNPFLLKNTGEDAVCVIKNIDSKTMRLARAKTKTLGVTLNDLFMASYAAALGRVLGLKKISLPCTVDLRKYNPSEAGVGNFTGCYNINIKVNRDSFLETLSNVAHNTQGQKNTYNDIAGPMLLVDKYNSSTLDKFMKTYGGMSTSNAIEYTNLGIIDKERLTFAEARPISVVGFSGLNKTPYFQLAVSSFDGETTLSSMTVCNKEEKALIEEVLDAVCSEITAFVK